MSYFDKKNTDHLFISLCQDYHEKILKYLYYSVKDIEDAKDLTQEVFMIIYNRMHIIENHPNKAGFIYQTAKYVAANFKRTAIKKALVDYPMEIEAATDFSDIYEEIENIYDKKIDENSYIDNVVTALSEEKQNLYNLRYIENKGYSEIAKSLGISEVNLRMKYVRLRREVKQLVKHVAKENF